MANTATNRIVRTIGRLHGPGVRPFVINQAQTFAFTTATPFLGFQVSNLLTGKVLFSVSPPGFTFNPHAYPHTPDHGISLSPDVKQLYLVDIPNGYVHVFDISRLPGEAPRDIANIKLMHPPTGNTSWLEHSLDGRCVFVGDSGDVIDTISRRVVAYLPELNATTKFVEIDWREGRPVKAGARCD